MYPTETTKTTREKKSSPVHSGLMDVEYPVMEDFYTIQGEGTHTGRAAYFIRLAGCDVQCWWCDVKDSWDGDKHPKIKTAYLENDGEISVLRHDGREPEQRPRPSGGKSPV